MNTTAGHVGAAAAAIAALVMAALLIAPWPATADAGMAYFSGSVTVDGAPVPDGTTVTAWVDGTAIGSTATKDSGYTIMLSGISEELSGKKVTFTVGKMSAGRSSLPKGEDTIAVDLSARTPTPHSAPGVSTWGFILVIMGLVVFATLMMRMHLDLRRA